jgi:hypothetical protein
MDFSIYGVTPPLHSWEMVLICKPVDIAGKVTTASKKRPNSIQIDLILHFSLIQIMRFM